MIFKKIILVCFLFCISSIKFTWAQENSENDEMIWDELYANLRARGGDTKALSHARCFLERHQNQTMKLHSQPSSPRCGRVENARPEISINNRDIFTIIDYNQNSNQKRMFLLNRKTGKVRSLAVAHGRYKAGYLNMILRDKKNTIKRARYFSNERGSNAPASGFYITGGEYEGKFGRSMILHGLEKNINHNACERAVVVHKHKMVTNNNAYVMSSGCPMIAPKNLNAVVDELKGHNGGGSMLFVYGPREREWEYGECPSLAQTLP